MSGDLSFSTFDWLHRFRKMGLYPSFVRPPGTIEHWSGVTASPFLFDLPSDGHVEELRLAIERYVLTLSPAECERRRRIYGAYTAAINYILSLKADMAPSSTILQLIQEWRALLDSLRLGVARHQIRENNTVVLTEVFEVVQQVELQRSVQSEEGEGA